MAITEPEAGSDSAAIRTTAVLDGDEYVLNGEKIFVTCRRARRPRRRLGDARPEPGPRRDQVVRRRALEPRAGARAAGARSSASAPRTPPRSGSSTAACPKENLLGSPEIEAEPGLRRRRCRRSTTRARWSPRWRSGWRARAWTKRSACTAKRATTVDWDRPAGAAARGRRRAAGAGGRLRGRPPAHAWRRAGWPTTAGPTRSRRRWRRPRPGAPAWTWPCAASGCAARVGYGEELLLEKWARDAKILDIFEGTQQIQLLIIARQLLGKTSAELR